MKTICPNKALYGRLWKLIKQWIDQFNMIENWDKIIVGVSWGKDSMTLLYFLSLFKKYKIFNFDILAVHIVSSPMFDGIDNEALMKPIFEELWVDYIFPTVDLEDKRFNKRDKLDCYWCSYQRRRIVFKAAEEYWCTKIAFGHHMDDIVITNFMNQLYVANIQNMRVNHSFFKWKYNIIRPMCFVREKDIFKFAQLMEFPLLPCNCTVDQWWRRKEVKEIFDYLESKIPNMAESVFDAFQKNAEKLEKAWLLHETIKEKDL